MFLVNLLTKSVFVFFQKLAILQFLTSNNFLKRTVRFCFFSSYIISISLYYNIFKDKTLLDICW